MAQSHSSVSNGLHTWLLPSQDLASREACYRLRYAYFVEEKAWVTAVDENGIESDSYDEAALHLSVWHEDEVIAYLRALPFNPDTGFMLDHEFSSLSQTENYSRFRNQATLELSRLVCRKLSANGAVPHPVELLLRRLYHLACDDGYDRFLIVVEKAWLRPFIRRFGLPFQTVGLPFVFPDGTETVFATATLEELEAGMRQHSAAKYDWYQRRIEG